MSPPRFDGALRAWARDVWRAATVALALLTPAGVLAQCNLSTEPLASIETPRMALHFGAPEDIPTHIQTRVPLGKTPSDLCVPIYAYNLGAGADRFEFAVRAPRAPLGFEAGPGIVEQVLETTVRDDGVVANLRLVAADLLCGPVLLGCLHLPSEGLPQRFALLVVPHEATGHKGPRLEDGLWRTATIDDGGAFVGLSPPCSEDPDLNLQITDLEAFLAPDRLTLELAWRRGTGRETLLRYRMGGPYPTTPSDGEFLALVPSGTERLVHKFRTSGEVHITAWSITRGPSGRIEVLSGVECGSLATSSVHLPIGVAERSWGQVKVLYR